MAIVDGGNEYLKPRNFALLFFNDQPQKYFPYAQIDVVYFPDDEGGDVIEEEIFKGPLDHQLRTALRHIRNSFISERIIKISGQAEAKRFFNYPYDAIEEALVNAVYHRGYDIREPIEVRINRNSISVVSHPGPDPSIKFEDVKAGKMVNRRYQNRRIGELLKELDFTEGRGTGVPKMRWACKVNGSPEPKFFTDDGRLSFWTTIEIHPEFLSESVYNPLKKQIEDTVEDIVEDIVEDTVETRLTETELKLLKLCLKESRSRKEILIELGHKIFSGNIRKALKRLKEMGLIETTIEDKPSSKNQRYKITEMGENYII